MATMTASAHTHLNNVRRYYEQTRTDYRVLWQGSAQAIHVGYWDEHIRSHNESLLEMNRQLAQAAGITGADHVLDAGCGIGGSSRWLAKTYGACVTGISITPFQVEQANVTTRKHGLHPLVHFELQDYTHTTFPAQSFSVVWFLESLVYAPDKCEAFKEVYRVLQPGGRLVIGDFTLADNLTSDQKSYMKPWWDGWAMPTLDTLPHFREALCDTGFTDIRIVNLNAHVQRSLKRLWLMSKVALPFARLFYETGIFPDLRYQNVAASVLQYESFKKGLWQYALITATKRK